MVASHRNRCTFLLTDDTVAVLKRIASEDGVTMSDVIRRAIRSEEFFHTARRTGERILVQDPETRQVREVLVR